MPDPHCNSVCNENHMHFGAQQIPHYNVYMYKCYRTPGIRNTLISLIAEEDHSKLISKYYSALLSPSTARMVAAQWKTDIPSLAEETWLEVLDTMVPSMISARDKMLQFNFLHRIYYTPKRLHKMGRRESPECPQCNAEVGDFFHMVWTCPRVMSYWRAILTYMEEKIGLPNIYSPARCLLGDLEEEELSTSQKTLLRRVFCYAKKALALRWKNPNPPSLLDWLKLVNNALPMYKLTYQARGSNKKFNKIWGKWIANISGEITV